MIYSMVLLLNVTTACCCCCIPGNAYVSYDAAAEEILVCSNSTKYCGGNENEVFLSFFQETHKQAIAKQRLLHVCLGDRAVSLIGSI